RATQRRTVVRLMPSCWASRRDPHPAALPESGGHAAPGAVQWCPLAPSPAIDTAPRQSSRSVSWDQAPAELLPLRIALAHTTRRACVPGRGSARSSMNAPLPLHACSAVGTLPNMPPAKRRPDVSWLPVLLPNVQALLDQGAATRGCTATVRGGHIIVGR